MIGGGKNEGGHEGGYEGDGGSLPGGRELPDAENVLWADRAAELVLANEVLPGPTAIPDMARLRAGLRSQGRTRRVTWAVGGLALAGAMGVLAVAITRPGQRTPPARPALAYVVEGAATVQGDSVEAPATTETGDTTRLRFTDGTAIALEPGARLRVPARTAVGAQLVLDRGRAAFTVNHLPGATWRVNAGPFTVEVTGTKFNVSWDARSGLKLDLESGGVIVRGSGPGPGVTVHPGETLTAGATDGRFTVAATSPQHGAGAVPARTETPADDPAAGAARAGAVPAAAAPASAAAAPTTAAAPRARTRAEARTLALASPTRDPSAASLAPPVSRPDLQPPAVMPTAPSLASGGGGVFCTRERAGLGFESENNAVWVPQVYHLAFQQPRRDVTHSWCGLGSVRLDVNFNETGRRNFMGRLPNQSGQIVFTLPRLMDFTDKTVSLHVFFDGPTDARVAAQLYVIHHGKWVNGPLVDHLVPRRWWTISHTFQAENDVTVGPPYPPGGTSRVTDCDRIALVVYSTGGPRTWSGAVYVDDVNWR